MRGTLYGHWDDYGALQLPLVFEAYRAGGELVARERVGARNPDEVLATLLCSGTDYVHIRNAEAGCFMAAIRPTY